VRGPEKVCPEKSCKYATPYEGDPDDINGPQPPRSEQEQSEAD